MAMTRDERIDRTGPSGPPRSKNASEDRGKKTARGPFGPPARLPAGSGASTSAVRRKRPPFDCGLPGFDDGVCNALGAGCDGVDGSAR